MIRLFIVLVVLASPVAAQRASDTERCTAGWRHLVGIVTGYNDSGGLLSFAMPEEFSNLRNLVQEPVADGWCKTIGAEIVQLSNIDSFTWWAEPLDFADDANRLPKGLAFQIDGSQIMNGKEETVEVSINLTHIPEDGLLIIERVGVVIADAQVLTASAVIGGAYFDDPRAAQMSLPGLHLDRLAATMGMAPEQASGFRNVSQEDILDFISGLSFAQLGRRSRSEAQDFARALPEPSGSLNVTYQSKRGLGWMQIGAATEQAAEDMPAFLLDGAEVTVDWQPN